jgi:succinate dehydrogenase/fumarate reductase cytochrome b subunit
MFRQPRLQRRQVGAFAEEIKELDRRRLAWRVVWICVLVIYLFALLIEVNHLAHERSVALARGAPYGCTEEGPAWSNLSLRQRVKETVLVSESRQMERCVEWLSTTSFIHLLPNVIKVAVDLVLIAPIRMVSSSSDGLGETVNRFLNHFGYPMQIVLIVAFSAVMIHVCNGSRSPPTPIVLPVFHPQQNYIPQQQYSTPQLIAPQPSYTHRHRIQQRTQPQLTIEELDEEC